MIHMKHFIKSSDDSSNTESVKNEILPIIKPAFVSGSTIKQFYESTVGRKAFDKTLDVEKVEPKNVTSTTKFKCKNKFFSKAPLNVNLLMKAIENGDFKEVGKVLEENKDSINCKDQFGWTPLMSACCAGNISMVEFLLQRKPDLNLRDKKGNTCLDLAQAKGFQNILDILNKHIINIIKPETVQFQISGEPVSKPTPFYCKECKQELENTSYKKHLLSMVHNFNIASKRKVPTFYGIPESNKGFQILVKSGWNKEEGLGPTGEGHKFPPKTILKQDRTGLGAKQYKAKVTHKVEDNRKDIAPKDTFKRQLRSKKRNEQRHERNLRRMLS